MRPAGERGLLAMICSAVMAFQPALGAQHSLMVGIVDGSGRMMLNGMAAPTGTLVFSGNRIEVGVRGTAYVALDHGGRILLGQSTSARVVAGADGYRVRLDHGVVGASSEAKWPILVTVGGLTIRAKQAAGAFVVSWDGSDVKVAAHRGTALLLADNRAVEIPEGKGLDARAGTPAGKSGTGAHKWLIGGVVAAAALGVGLGVGLATQGNCASPYQLTCQ